MKVVSLTQEALIVSDAKYSKSIHCTDFEVGSKVEVTYKGFPSQTYTAEVVFMEEISEKHQVAVTCDISPYSEQEAAQFEAQCRLFQVTVNLLEGFEPKDQLLIDFHMKHHNANTTS